VDKSTGLRSDQTVVLSVQKSSKDYPRKLRRVIYFDEETGKRLIFLTNNFKLPALTVAKLYKLRWQVELFFKWIKQHLRIKSFYGRSPSEDTNMDCHLGVGTRGHLEKGVAA
jgi:IS4 transposase